MLQFNIFRMHSFCHFGMIYCISKLSRLFWYRTSLVWLLCCSLSYLLTTIWNLNWLVHRIFEFSWLVRTSFQLSRLATRENCFSSDASDGCCTDWLVCWILLIPNSWSLDRPVLWNYCHFICLVGTCCTHQWLVPWRCILDHLHCFNFSRIFLADVLLDHIASGSFQLVLVSVVELLHNCGINTLSCSGISLSIALIFFILSSSNRSTFSHGSGFNGKIL